MPKKKIVILATSSPFATLNNHEVLRMTLGLIDLKVSVIWRGDGVYNSVKGVDNRSTQPFIKLFLNLDVGLYVDRGDLEERGLDGAELISEVTALESSDVLDLVNEADVVLTF